MKIIYIVDVSGSMLSGPKFSIIFDLLDCSLYYLRNSKAVNESDNALETAIIYPSDNIYANYFNVFETYPQFEEISYTNYEKLNEFISENIKDSLFFFFTDMTENILKLKESDNLYTVIVGNDNKSSAFNLCKNTITADCFINKFLTIYEKETGESL